MQILPINDVLPDIKDKLTTHNRLVLQAPPGAGKTTAIPIALLGQNWLGDRQIIMLEPRRLAARNAAARMAFLLNEKVGETVGYQVRQDNCFSDKTKILVVTEGILTRKLQADPELKKIALVIFDEFHERSLHADLSLALCLQSQQILREDLKILVMSATLNTDAVATLLDNAPIIQSEGRSFPVENKYLDKVIRQHNTNPQQQLMINLTNTISKFIHQHEGNCLVFLPGVKEINQLSKQIKLILELESIKNILIAPLHGSLNKQQQDLAIASPKDKYKDKAMRKIVLATNIAETSITIEGISCVIDSGLERMLDYNPASGMNRLNTHSISQDSAVQRSGRAGRLSAGTCYRMWTAEQQPRLLKHASAEILHSDLSSLVLELANWGVTDVNEMQWMDFPPSSATEQAKTLLQQLNAIDEQGKINAHGRDMLKLGTHPRLAHMMLASLKLNQTYHACLIASLLTEKDIFQANAKNSIQKSADIHDRLNILVHGRSNQHGQHGIDSQQCKRIIQTTDDFFKRVKQCNPKIINTATLNKETPNANVSGVLLAYAYPDRIAKRRNGNQARYLLSNGKGAFIPPYFQHHLHEYLVIANLDAKQGEACIYLAADISEEQLQEYFSNNIQHEERVEWNESAQRVEAKQTRCIGKLILQESILHDIKKPETQEAIQQCLMQAIRESKLECLNWNVKADSLKQRVQFINHHLNNNSTVKKQFAEQSLPDFSEQTLSDTLHEWLQPYLKNENSLKQCFKLDCYSLLLNLLSWKQQQLIKQLAPERISVPSGSAVNIDYTDPVQPVLAVRLQEVFGLYDTPTVLKGHCKLMMHLLSPARKPMQITQDLNSFWKTTYHDVKKELRGKYKRHYWPDDPFTAQATSKTKKQMNRDA